MDKDALDREQTEKGAQIARKPEYRVLVCGGRKYNDMAAMTRVLDGIHPRPTLIIHGAARGADECAWRWACKNFVPDKAFPADWGNHGRAAGPIRNQQMLDEGKPHLVVAFPGGRGTHDMVTKAKTAGLPVVEAAEKEWKPIDTAPKDGTPVWLCDKHGDAGGPFPMFWNPRGRNAIFQPGSVGIWELDGGGMTWTDENPAGAPEMWAPRTSDICPIPPWINLH